MEKKVKSIKEDYCKFTEISGEHPFQEAMKDANAFVTYEARTIKNCSVLFFNFDLAKEMGLLPKEHPHYLNNELIDAILDTFAITIINEYDISHHTTFDPATKKPHRYMATRYLQLQHPNKKGKTSGDGRSIWNGCLRHNGKTFDISSCGTGATCLSPAAAIEGKFFKTGDPSVSYGCGMAEISDGYSAAVLSEIFHRSGINTERTLAIIDVKNGCGINVRVGENLIRPSHFFLHLKQANHKACKSISDYYIDREVSNHHLILKSNQNRYLQYLEHTVEIFAKIAAQFESEYIFCWLAWDGDNILANGGIIDYGSVRQFGLFHHKYRYDDIDRFSTNIIEQKRNAKYIVQTYIQLIDFIMSGSKKNIKLFAKHPLLKLFDEIYEEEKKLYLLQKIGLSEEKSKHLLHEHKKMIEKFQKSFYYFERQTSSKGEVKVADGINRNAIFCMRDLLRELAQHHLQTEVPLATSEFLRLMKSTYATNKDMAITPYRIFHASRLQKYYLQIIKLSKESVENIALRAMIINKPDRTTGNAIIIMADEMIRKKKDLDFDQFNKITESFIKEQTLYKHHLDYNYHQEYQNISKSNSKLTKQSDTNILLFPLLHGKNSGHPEKELHPTTPAKGKTSSIGKIIKKLLRIVHDNRESV
ncbi:MAG: hypothetical protein HQK50_04580 [Oligoflexia bacterium]|nr:hypothetical protein [Oligoflexia bacterium]MBF0364821.1 hypothetical protein [Oligoflexia bacterium]